MKAVAYYRTRPGEPDASKLALRLQQEAVRAGIERDGCDLAAEFIEREGEPGAEAWPAYAAAVNAAVALKTDESVLDVMFHVASRCGIGSGEPFERPWIGIEGGLWNCDLNAELVPTRAEIPVPQNAPAPICLYGEYRRTQLDTNIYFCNAGPDALVDVALGIEVVSGESMQRWPPGEPGPPATPPYERRWDAIPAGRAVLVGRLYHGIRNDVCRYRLTFAAGGHRRAMQADDDALSTLFNAESLDPPWVPFAPGPC